MPNITVALDAIIHDSRVQWDVYNSSRAEVTSNIPIRPNKTMAVRQFEAMFMYTSALRRILVKMAENIKVNINQDRKIWDQILPALMIAMSSMKLFQNTYLAVCSSVHD